LASAIGASFKQKMAIFSPFSCIYAKNILPSRALILEATTKNVAYSSERTYNKELAMLVEIVVVLPLPKIKDFWAPITISQEM
jgi:hypothetical protein